MKRKWVAGMVCIMVISLVMAVLLMGNTATAEETSVTAPYLYFIGHASIMLETAGGTVIYVDPSYAGDYGAPADIILITHAHDDHNKPKLVTKKPDCVTITWKEALAGGEHQSFEVQGVTIQAVPAANKNHSIKSSVGYVLTFDGIVFYHAGDTSMLESMSELAELEIDYAMYPVDGRYNMGVDEAVVVAGMVKAKHSIPMHFFVEGEKMAALQAEFIPERALYVGYGERIMVE